MTKRSGLYLKLKGFKVQLLLKLVNVTQNLACQIKMVLRWMSQAFTLQLLYLQHQFADNFGKLGTMTWDTVLKRQLKVLICELFSEELHGYAFIDLYL